jgi:hypothetical protein
MLLEIGFTNLSVSLADFLTDFKESRRSARPAADGDPPKWAVLTTNDQIVRNLARRGK